jgi:hypothetical protein
MRMRRRFSASRVAQDLWRSGGSHATRFWTMLPQTDVMAELSPIEDGSHVRPVYVI